MILIIEGIDRVGKDTQIELIKQYLEYKNCPVHLLHYSNIKGKQNKNDIQLLSKKLYIQMFKLLIKAHTDNSCIICNRSHLGEAVYSPLYRKYNGDYVFDLEQKFVKKFNNNIGLIVFSDKPENVIKRDDNQSFSTDLSLKTEEIKLFREAYEKSLIKNKRFVELNGRGVDKIFEDEVLPVLKNLIHKEELIIE